MKSVGKIGESPNYVMQLLIFASLMDLIFFTALKILIKF
jgi:hypothetical protein